MYLHIIAFFCIYVSMNYLRFFLILFFLKDALSDADQLR